MEQNDQLDALKFLSETHRSLHEKRQKHEWKIIFSVLTFFVTSIGAVYSQKVCLPDGGMKYYNMDFFYILRACNYWLSLFYPYCKW